jgi:hypothetical protein
MSSVLTFVLSLALSSQVWGATFDVKSYYGQLFGKSIKTQGMHLEIDDTKNGYLKIGANMEGYFILVLFKGKGRDYVLQQTTGCGPECDQKFQMHVFQNGKLIKSSDFGDFYPKAKVDEHIQSVISTMPSGVERSALQSWIRLPRNGKSIQVLIMDQNPAVASDEVKIYEAGLLNWDGTRFSFKSAIVNKPSAIHAKEIH